MSQSLPAECHLCSPSQYWVSTNSRINVPLLRLTQGTHAPVNVLHLLYGVDVNPRTFPSPDVQQEDYPRSEYWHLRNKPISARYNPRCATDSPSNGAAPALVSPSSSRPSDYTNGRHSYRLQVRERTEKMVSEVME